MDGGTGAILIACILILFLFILLIRVPIMIAKARHVSGGELTTVAVLSWCGIFLGITWFIALILALVYQPSNWVNKEESPADMTKVENRNLDDLDKLYQLKEKGALTEAEFQTQKNKILKL